MDEVTQQNSALVEEAAATAKTLEHQSATMSAEVNVFNIGEDDEAPLVPAMPARAEASARAAARPQRAARSEAPARIAKPAAPRRRAPVGEMQGALAVAYQDPEWKDF